MRTTRDRLIKRLVWDGPHPHPGEYLAVRSGGVWLIRDVSVLRDGRIELYLHSVADALPRQAVIHAATRAQRTDAAGPPRIRQLAGAGPTAVMRASWRDPTDLKPNASRRAREQHGFRIYCPLRRMQMAAAAISTAHILAADALRLDWDAACIGLTAARDGISAAAQPGPVGGPSAAAQAQTQAARAVRRALARFTAGQQQMLIHIVIGNHSLFGWCTVHGRRNAGPVDRHREMGRLLAVLDILAEHYASEVDQALRTGRMLAV